jgi:ubiquinone/menaquinone biosynthesis C-methylase UbiE
MRVNIGSGKFTIPGFINLDKEMAPGVDFVSDFKKLPFRDNYFEEIYAGHALQCVRPNEIDATLREWYRVLSTEGKITVVVPEIEFLTRSYISGEINLEVFTEICLRGLDNPDGLWTNAAFFDKDKLARSLMRAGFREIKELSLSQCPYVTAQVSWQIGMEGVKP